MSLSQLAKLTGVERRTIRSYIAQGLLRGPETVGRNASYSRHHLDRLRALRVFREQEGLGLSEIRQRFMTLGDEAITAVAARLAGSEDRGEGGVRESDAKSASAYIKALRATLKAEPQAWSDPAARLALHAGRVGSAAELDETRIETGSDSTPSEPGTAGIKRSQKALARLRPHSPAALASPPLRAALHVPSGAPSRPESSHRADTERWMDHGEATWLQRRRHKLAGDPGDEAGSRAVEGIAHELRALHHAVQELNLRANDARGRNDEVLRRLEDTQRELEDLRRMLRGISPPADGPLPPAQGATGGSAAQREAAEVESFVRLSVLPNVEVVVRGVPDERRLGRLKRLAEGLRQALLEGDEHDR